MFPDGWETFGVQKEAMDPRCGSSVAGRLHSHRQPLGVSGHRREKRSLSPCIVPLLGAAGGAPPVLHNTICSSVPSNTSASLSILLQEAARGGKTVMMASVCSTHPWPIFFMDGCQHSLDSVYL